MKKPILVAAICGISQIILGIVVGVVIVSLLLGGATSYALLIPVAVLFFIFGISVVLFYYGFFVLAKKFKNKILGITSYIYMIWVAVSFMGIIIAGIYFLPKWTELYRQVQETAWDTNAPLTSENPNIDSTASQLSDQEGNQKSALANPEPNESQTDTCDTSLSDDNCLQTTEASENQDTATTGVGYLIVVSAAMVLFGLLELFFSLGIFHLGEKVKYSKVTGILGMIVAVWSMIYALVYLIVGLIGNEMVVLVILSFMIFINLLFGLVSLAFYILQLIFLFRASGDLESKELVFVDKSQK